MGGLKIFAAKGGASSRNGRGLPYCIEVFLEIAHDAAYKKNLDLFIFPLLTKMCYKIIA